MNNIKNMRYVLIFAYILTAALFFAAGCAVGLSSGRKISRGLLEEYSSAEPTAAINASAGAQTEETEYAVVLNNGILAVYEMKNDTKVKITEHKISEAVYPKDDIDELKKGMVFSDKNAAMAMFENFAS